jgi:hypothetical protein
LISFLFGCLFVSIDVCYVKQNLNSQSKVNNTNQPSNHLVTFNQLSLGSVQIECQQTYLYLWNKSKDTIVCLMFVIWSFGQSLFEYFVLRFSFQSINQSKIGLSFEQKQIKRLEILSFNHSFVCLFVCLSTDQFWIFLIHLSNPDSDWIECQLWFVSQFIFFLSLLFFLLIVLLCCHSLVCLFVWWFDRCLFHSNFIQFDWYLNLINWFDW